MANVPIRDIPQTGTPSASSYIVFDDGSMKKGLVSDLADGVRPIASQSEAQAGSDNTKTMTPLRVKQSIASEVGVSVQAHDTDLDAWAGKTAPSGAAVGTTDAQTLTNKTLTAPAITSPTGLVKADVGLGNVNNTSDANKPVSTATQTALDLKANTADLGDLATKDKISAPGDINATGTPSASTALFGDGSWKVPAGGGDMLGANNLSDVDDADSARVNIGAGDMLASVYDPNAVAADAFDSSNTAFLQSGTGAVSRSARSKMREVQVTPQDFGAVADGVTDDLAAINRAIAELSARGGGTLFFPPGAYAISAIVEVGTSNIRLIGASQGNYHYTGTSIVAATQLVWAGASSGVMVKFNPSGTQWLEGNAFDGIYLNPGSGAGTGLQTFSTHGGRFIAVGSGFTSTILWVGCSSSLSETADNMHNYYEVRGSVSNSAAIVQFTGISTANTCFNRIGLIEGNYENGSAVQFYNSDNNIVDSLRLYRQSGKTGNGVVFASGASNQQARSNIIIDCSPGDGGVVAQGTETGDTTASSANYIAFYDTPNGAPLPSIGTGASLLYGTLDNKFPCAAAHTSTGTYTATSATDIAWDGEIFDVQGNFSSPTFTAPKPGKYAVRWKLSHTTGVTVGTQWKISVVTPHESNDFAYVVTTTANPNSVSDSCTVDLKAGDTVKLQIARNSGSGSFPLVGDGAYNRFEVNYIAQSW